MSDLTRLACDPERSAVVEACAGSGKTWLLTSRLFRLLLAGARPDQILAITFTRKAAQEMKERLFDLLRECALANDTALSDMLTLRGAQATAANLVCARGLAGQVLTNPRGVTIDTFHGWFASLCQMAPLASGFSRQSEPTDHPEFLMDEALGLFVNRLLQGGTEQAEQLAAFDSLAGQLDRTVVLALLKRALGNRVACRLWLGNSQAPSLADVFGLDPSHDWPAHALNDSALLTRLWEVARWLGKGTPAQQTKAVQLESALTRFEGGDCDPYDAFVAVTGVCLKKDGTVGSAFIKPTKAQTLDPSFEENQYRSLFEGVCESLANALLLEKDQADMRATQSLAKLIEPLFATYTELKAERGLCDFDDLEDTALSMLMDDAQRAYMQQKLDSRVKHLLVDEFQDTNPVQWNILKLWLADYSAQDKPTVFLVGDPKQSIYRFRRAEARLFNHARAWLQANFNAESLHSNSTRRCSQAVVDVVNAAFATGNTRGATTFNPHESLASPKLDAMSGLFLYPLIGQATEDGEPPTGTASEAECVVRTLQAWLADGTIRSLGEVMVLIRAHKSGLPLMQALREAQLPYTVKDQGERYTSPVWSDTIALLGFLSNPHDNLHVLQLLRCPLVGISSDTLQGLIEAERDIQAGTVWGTIEALAKQGVQPWVQLQQRFAQWLALAHSMPLFETINQVVSDTQAAVKYLNMGTPRQRVMMAEHWDWLKGWALSLNKGRFPDLQSAYDEAVRLQTYVNSDSEGAGGDEQLLRIMTVHSAKGLEARRVWLFDANSVPKPGGSTTDLLIDWRLGDSHPTSVTVMRNLGDHSPGRANAQAIEAQAYADEEDHLLYVALTRAEQSIHVSGSEKKGGAKGWYARLLPLVGEEVTPWSAPLDVKALHSLGVASHWVRPQFPALCPPATQVGRVVPRLRGSELRMGTAWHAAMEHVDGLKAMDFTQWWAGVSQACEAQFMALSESELAEVEQTCRATVSNAELLPWLAGAPKAFNELEWINGEGRSLRADRVVEFEERFVVLDYKWSVNDLNWSEYKAQVTEYVALVDSTLARCGGHVRKSLPTQAALIDRQGKIHWLTSV